MGKYNLQEGYTQLNLFDYLSEVIPVKATLERCNICGKIPNKKRKDCFLLHDLNHKELACDGLPFYVKLDSIESLDLELKRIDNCSNYSVRLWNKRAAMIREKENTN